jgi:AraC-like DNA-binding protein
MESLFFNITDTNYKVTNILKIDSEIINRVDISNGIVFFQINLQNRSNSIKFKNIDRMLMLTVVQKGELKIDDSISNHIESVSQGEIGLFVSSHQDMTISIKKTQESSIVLIFIADFLLKRYLTYKEHEPIDFIYNKLQKDISLELISKEPIDALSLYIIDTLLNISSKHSMLSIRAEHKVLEFIIHRLSLLNINKPEIDSQSYNIANRAKDILTREYISPPSIKELAHRCATNETKLKKVFKIVYHSTIREYIQKLRLEEANILLKEESLTIKEVANRVGYRHQGYFSKLFFEYYGVYPVALIKKFH